MEFAYGYKVGSKAFDHLGLPPDRIIIDSDSRRERLAFLLKHRLRPGHEDIVHVIREAHIPQSKQREALEATATIQLSPAPKTAKPAHRPAQFVPTDYIRGIWADYRNSTAWCVAEARKVTNSDVTRETLYYHLGKRN